MTLPEKIKVGAYAYKVETVTRLCNADHTRLQGEHDPSQFVIRIDEGITAQRERVVLLHELIHAIEDERTLDLTEACVNQLAHALSDMFLDNPELTRLFLPEREAS